MFFAASPTPVGKLAISQRAPLTSVASLHTACPNSPPLSTGSISAVRVHFSFFSACFGSTHLAAELSPASRLLLVLAFRIVSKAQCESVVAAREVSGAGLCTLGAS